MPYAAALREWRPLAEEGDLDAQLYLGEIYLRGKGVDRDFKKALEWLAKAAQAGHPEAQGVLGGLYAVGLGVPQDFGVAYFWMIVAAIWSEAEIRQQAPVAAPAPPGQRTRARDQFSAGRSSGRRTGAFADHPGRWQPVVPELL